MTTNTTSSPQPTSTTDRDLDWLLDDLAGRVVHVESAAVLSRDGLVLGASAALSREDAEHLAALAAGLQSLANSGAQRFGAGHVQQTVVEMDRRFLFVIAAGEGCCLAVLATSEVDVGLVAYEMALIVKKVGRHLAVDGRQAAEAAGAM
ncbi:MAG TPA: roadblock/LC7 domain-containing protein [Streptosporangiaceae bacterium]|nr:roadblock/LC7 domain-containing protein [Streptosporangiaceae bacterium]